MAVIQTKRGSGENSTKEAVSSSIRIYQNIWWKHVAKIGKANVHFCMNLKVSSAKKKIKNNKSETLDYGDGAFFTPEIQNVVLILLPLKISQTSFSILIETDAM